MWVRFQRVITASLAGMFSMIGVILIFNLFKEQNILIGIFSFIIGVILFERSMSI